MNKRVAVLITILFSLVLSVYAQEANVLNARITELSGTVEIMAPGEYGWRPASVGDIIGRDSVVSTGFRSNALLQAGSTVISVRPLTRLTLEEIYYMAGTETLNVNLQAGRIRADLNPPAGTRAVMSVSGPMVTAAARGTSFTFNGRRLLVHSGQVDLANNLSEQRVFVSAGQHSNLDRSRQGFLTLPFEAQADALRATLPILTETGMIREQPSGTAARVGANIDFQWPSP